MKDSILIAKRAGERLVVAGGWGLSLDPALSYAGFVGGKRKNRIIADSKCLLTPVLWNEPFGLSIVECFYFGVPAIGTPYGDLPEIIKPDVGFISNKRSELVDAVKNAGIWSRKRIHEYACDNFSTKQMTAAYLKLYDIVLKGRTLNPRKPKSLPENFTADFPMYD